jgi:hypothetical protein
MDKNTIKTGGITFVNADVFENWLRENLKRGYHEADLRDWLSDLESRMGETGATSYELPSHMTVSGSPECIYFEREDLWNDDGDELIETIITF